MKDSTSKLRFYSAWQNMCQIFTQLKWTPWWRNKKKWSRQQYYTPWNATCLGKTQMYSWRNYNRVEPPSSVGKCSKEGRQHTLAGKNGGRLSRMFWCEGMQQSSLIKSVELLTSYRLCHGRSFLSWWWHLLHISNDFRGRKIAYEKQALAEKWGREWRGY